MFSVALRLPVQMEQKLESGEYVPRLTRFDMASTKPPTDHFLAPMWSVGLHESRTSSTATDRPTGARCVEPRGAVLAVWASSSRCCTLCSRRCSLLPCHDVWHGAAPRKQTPGPWVGGTLFCCGIRMLLERAFPTYRANHDVSFMNRNRKLRLSFQQAELLE